VNASLATQARALYEQRQYAELDALLAPHRDELAEASPYLGFWLADAWRRLGKQTEALELVQSFSAASRRSGIPRLELDRLNLEGMLRFETGDTTGAEASWRELLARADSERSDDFIARANNNLGIIYTLQARVAEAVMSYQRALTAYQMLGARRGLAQSHQNLAITYRELDAFDDADNHFVQAIRFAGESNSEDELGRAEYERALLIYLSRRDAGLARVTANRGKGRFTSLNDPIGVADCLRILAMIDLGEGMLADARANAERALNDARRVGHLLLQGELLEVLAATARKSNELERAAAFENEAATAFANARATAWGERFRLLTERL
jgi:tetratricopeptide (TPR) repeat protein